MIDNWIDFTLSVAGGGMALLFLFEGTRRLAVYGAHRRAGLMLASAALVCTLYGGYAYWTYLDNRTTLNVVQRKPAASQLPRDWGRALAPEKREAASLARARNAFRESGEIGTYFDRTGEVRTFAPNLEDVQRRERVVTYTAQAEHLVRLSLAETLLWVILAPVAIVLGLLMSLDRGPPKSADGEGELDGART